MNLAEFQRQIFNVAAESSICGIPFIRRLNSSSVNIRVEMTMGGFIDAFRNTQTGTTAYAFIQEGRRVFGADNTGGWHVHPFDDPSAHQPLRSAMSFVEFVSAIGASAAI